MSGKPHKIQDGRNNLPEEQLAAVTAWKARILTGRQCGEKTGRKESNRMASGTALFGSESVASQNDPVVDSASILSWITEETADQLLLKRDQEVNSYHKVTC